MVDSIQETGSYNGKRLPKDNFANTAKIPRLFPTRDAQTIWQ